MRYAGLMESYEKLLKDSEAMEALLLAHGLATISPFDGSCIHQPILVDENYEPVPVGDLTMLYHNDLPVPVVESPGFGGWELPPEFIGGGLPL
jgi:hypothetical protein